MKKEKLKKKEKMEKVRKGNLNPAALDSAKSRAARAGLVFPVSKIHNKLKNLVPIHCRVGGTAAVFLAAVIEYLVAELCELSGNRAKREKYGANYMELIE